MQQTKKNDPILVSCQLFSLLGFYMSHLIHYRATIFPINHFIGAKTHISNWPLAWYKKTKSYRIQVNTKTYV